VHLPTIPEPCTAIPPTAKKIWRDRRAFTNSPRNLARRSRPQPKKFLAGSHSQKKFLAGCHVVVMCANNAYSVRYTTNHDTGGAEGCGIRKLIIFTQQDSLTTNALFSLQKDDSHDSHDGPKTWAVIAAG
jgi:hypothetical protein